MTSGHAVFRRAYGSGYLLSVHEECGKRVVLPIIYSYRRIHRDEIDYRGCPCGIIIKWKQDRFGTNCIVRIKVQMRCGKPEACKKKSTLHVT